MRLMEEQTWNSLEEAMAKGLDQDSVVYDRYQVLLDEQIQVQEQIEGLEPGDIPDWNIRAQNVLAEYRALLKHLNVTLLGKERTASFYRPLLWGAGAVLAAVGVAWFVYERRV